MSPQSARAHVMLTDVTVIDFAMDVDVWKCLFNWFPVSRVGRREEGQPRERASARPSAQDI